MIDVSDVWMTEGGDCVSLLAKAAQARFILHKLSGKEFECDRPAQLRIVCEVDFPHPSSAEQRTNLIPAQTLSRRKRHAPDVISKSRNANC